MAGASGKLQNFLDIFKQLISSMLSEKVKTVHHGKNALYSQNVYSLNMRSTVKKCL